MELMEGTLVTGVPFIPWAHHYSRFAVEVRKDKLSASFEIE
jgi:hypothetical protein